MQEPSALLSEALKSGYGALVLLIVIASITRPVWLVMMRTFQDWVRSSPVRRRVTLEGRAVEQALTASTKEQGDRACEVLRLLLRAPDPELPQQDPPEAADTSTGDPPQPDEASRNESPDGGTAGAP